jgi:hypothetical protein
VHEYNEKDKTNNDRDGKTASMEYI